MKKVWRATVVLAGAAVLAAGCMQTSADRTDSQILSGQKEEKIDQKQARLDALEPTAYSNVDGLNLEAGTYISIIGKASGGDFWDDVEEGAKQAVADINKALGYKGEDKVRMVYSGPSEDGDVDEQVNILDEELARYPEAVGISIIDSQSGDVQFDLAAENGISIVTFDSDSNYQNVMAKVSTDNTAAAEEAAGYLAEDLKEQGKVILFVHDSRSLTARERADAFTAKMQADHPGIQIVNTYYLDQMDDMKKTVADAINAGTYAPEGQKPAAAADEESKTAPEDISDEEVMDYIFAQNPDADAIYGTSSEAVMAAADNKQRLGRDSMKIVGFDATQEEVEALKDGLVDGLVAQNPYGMGYATVVACSRAILQIGNEAQVNAGYTWIDADNVDNPEVAVMLY